MINDTKKETYPIKKIILLIFKLFIPALTGTAAFLIVRPIPDANIWPLSNWLEYIFYILSMAVYLLVKWPNNFKKIKSLINWLSYTSIFLILANVFNWHFSSHQISIDFPSIVLISFNLYLFSISLYWLIPRFLSNKIPTNTVNNYSGPAVLIDNSDKLKDLSEKQDKILPFIRIIVPTIFTISITWGLLSLSIISLSGNNKDSSWTSWLAPTGTLFSALITVIGAVIGTYTIYLNGKEQRLFDENKFKNEYARQTTESKRLASEFADVQAREKEEFRKEQAQKLMLSLDENYYKAIQSNDIEKIDLSALSNLTKNWEIYSSDFNEINKIKNIQIFNILNKMFSTYTSVYLKYHDAPTSGHPSPEPLAAVVQRTFDLGSFNPITETKNSKIVNTFKEVSLTDLEFINGWIYNLDFSKIDFSGTSFRNISFCNCVLPENIFNINNKLIIDHIISTTIENKYYINFEVDAPAKTVSNVYSNSGLDLLVSWNKKKTRYANGISDYDYVVNREYNNFAEVFNSILGHNENCEYQFVMFSGVSFYSLNSSIIFKDCLFIDCNLNNVNNSSFIDCKFYFSTRGFEPSVSNNTFYQNRKRSETIFKPYIAVGNDGFILAEIMNRGLTDRIKEKIMNYLFNANMNRDSKEVSCSLIEISRVDIEIRDVFFDIFISNPDKFNRYIRSYTYSRSKLFSDHSPAYIFLSSIIIFLNREGQISIRILKNEESQLHLSDESDYYSI